MKFFIDTANIKEIKAANEMGLIDGVTTNPSLMAKENREPRELLKEICKIVKGPVSAEVVALDAKGMVAEGRELARIAKNIVIKVPITTDGLVAVKQLKKHKIKTNVTLCFSPVQALLAAKAGAAYISPFVGRLDDISIEGMDLIDQIVNIYDNYMFDTEVLVASVRSPMHVLEAAMVGADVATIPFKVIEQLAKHPLTDIGLAKFLDDWKKVPQKKTVSKKKGRSKK
jgi:transaldolase